eukprot:11776988-Prorocentrum_lima.AAC.1
MDLVVVPSIPTQMSAIVWNLEHLMHAWDYDHNCFITSHDPEAGDDIELYLPPSMAHWHNSCPHELQPDERLVLT